MAACTIALAAGNHTEYERRQRRIRVRNSMAKKYTYVREKVPNQTGNGFVEAIRLALVEFSCLGEVRYEVTGYPYASVEDALASDMIAIGVDYKRAKSTLNEQIRREELDKAREKTAIPAAETDNVSGET